MALVDPDLDLANFGSIHVHLAHLLSLEFGWENSGMQMEPFSLLIVQLCLSGLNSAHWRRWILTATLVARPSHQSSFLRWTAVPFLKFNFQVLLFELLLLIL